MVRFTPDGRFIFDNELSGEGDPTIISGLFLMDMERVYTLVSHTSPKYTLTTGLHSKAVVGGYISFQVELACVNYVDPGTALSVDVPIPSGFSLISATSNEGTYTASTEKWTPTLNEDDTATLDLILSADTAGATSHIVVLDDDTTVTDTGSCTVASTDTGAIYYTDIPITDLITLANLQDGDWYTVTVYNYVNDTGIVGVYDGVKNNRLTVINGDTTYGGRVTTEATWTKIRCNFVYDETETLTIRLYGQYQAVSTGATDEYAGFVLREYARDDTYSAPGNLLSDPELLFAADPEATVTVPALESSATYEVTTPAISLTSDPDYFYKGLIVNLGVGYLTNSQVNLSLTPSNGVESTTRSVVGTTTGDITEGGETDLWGFSSEDIWDETLTTTFSIDNLSNTSMTWVLSNLYLSVYYDLDVTFGAPGFTYNDTHSRVFGVYFQDNQNPEGPELDLTTLELPYMDGSLLVTQDIRPKKITVNFALWGDDIEEVVTKLGDVSTWLGNPRDSNNKPIPRSLIFDYNPSRTYQAILEGPIDVTTKATTLFCKATFIIPSGVAESATPKVTGSNGSNDGVTRVRPVLTLIGQDASTVTITDTVSGQVFTLNHTISEGVVFTIDCGNRTVTDTTGTDYTTSVDINSQWIGLLGVYDLSVVGASLQSVTYTEAY